jgi:hypothetical protein
VRNQKTLLAARLRLSSQAALIVDSEKFFHSALESMLLIESTFQASDQLGFMVIQAFDRSNVTFQTQNDRFVARNLKDEQALARILKERIHPVSAFRLGRGFLF